MLSMAAAVLLSGCTEETLTDEKPIVPVTPGTDIIFGSSLSGDGVDTKTVYGDRTTDGVPVYWKETGDSIAIFCLQASAPANHLVNYKVLPVLDDNGDPTSTAASVTKFNPEEAGLQWGDLTTKHRFYAFYPARAVLGSAEENETGMITASIPVTQQVQEWRTVEEGANGALQGKKTYFGLPDMDYAYMYAYSEVDPSKTGADTPVNLAFHNLVTVLDITIQGPSSGTATVTNINVDAIAGEKPILTGDFTCNIRNTETGTIGTCSPVGSFSEERGRISIPCYDKKTGSFIQLGPDELLNVKAYIIPQDVDNTVTKRTLRVTVSLLNGAPCRKTLNTADVTAHKINRVILPPLAIGGTNYWMSSLDPNIYVTELSIPGSKFSVLTSENGASKVYQNTSIDQQFEDGVRAFIFQTATIHGGLFEGFQYKGFHVVCENKNRTVMRLSEAIAKIAAQLKACEDAGKKNEFAFVMLTYTSGDVPAELPVPDNEQYWIKKLRDEVNTIAGDAANRIYTGEITPETTIDDVKGKIILKANYNSQNMINGYGNTTAPIMFTFWGAATGPEKGDWTYQDNNGGMPMDWGVPVWYANSKAQLRWYYQEVTSVGSGQEATKQQKEDGIKHLFLESVNMYKNDNSHRTWFMNDLGGYYSDSGDINGRGTGIEALAIDMNQLGVDELQNREENAGLGIVFMNFADKQYGGTKYKSDWLIQTLIDNNFKFALRKKGTSTTSYDAKYTDGGNAIGWDE